jgi:phosphohistidine phosphatase
MQFLNSKAKEMVRNLYLMRHAQAAENYGYDKDIERELTATGLRQAVIIGKHLHEAGVHMDLILSSTAERARHTATLVADCLHYAEDNIDLRDGIYNEPISGLLRLVNSIDAGKTSVLLVAHNPAVSFFAEYLSNADIGAFSTGTLVHLTFEGEWAACGKNTCTFKFKWEPENLIR